MKNLIKLCLLIAVSLTAIAEPTTPTFLWTVKGQEQNQGSSQVFSLSLTPEVYKTLNHADLSNIRVVDSKGGALPHRLVDPKLLMQTQSRLMQLTWFDLPKVQIKTPQGELKSVPQGWIFDQGQRAQNVESITLDWQALESGFETNYSVYGSYDLTNWQVLDHRIQLLDLVKEGRRLKVNQIVFDKSNRPVYRYFKLVNNTPSDNTSLTLLGVKAQLAPEARTLSWEWLSLQGELVTEQGQRYYRYRLPGRFPIFMAKVELRDQVATQWQLSSRDQSTGAWENRVMSLASYRLKDYDSSKAALPMAKFEGQEQVRDQYWQLHATQGMGTEPPVLWLAYEPDELWFVSDTLVGVRVQVTPTATYLQDTTAVEMLTQVLAVNQHGLWKPTSVVLSNKTVHQITSNEEAKNQGEETRDWTYLIAIFLLALGAASIVIMSVRLLKKAQD